MNCPYCTKEMETGYLRGGSGYELLWTEEPFKMTSLSRPETISSSAKHPMSTALSPTFAAPAARSSWTSKNKKAPQISRPAALSAKIYHTAFAAPRRTGPRTPPHLPPAGGK